MLCGRGALQRTSAPHPTAVYLPLKKGMLGTTVPMCLGAATPSTVAPFGCLSKGHMLDPRVCTKLHLNPFPIPRKRLQAPQASA